MKKKILLTAGLLLSLFAQNSLLAQDAAGTGFQDVKGMNVLNAGIGLGSYGLSGTGGIPLVASFEHGFTKNISAGGTLGFIQQKFSSDWKYTYLMIGARGSYHLNEAFKIANPNVDVYAGAGLLYRRFSVKYAHDDVDNQEFDLNSSGGDFTVQLHAGARYFFNSKVGAFAELGYGISPLQLGVSVKF
ncbi:MAG TPA: outer membrane beta-barrel protein [Flavisolibacter sp.]